MIHIEGKDTEIMRMWTGGMAIAPCGLTPGDWYFADIHLEPTNREVTAVIEVIGESEGVCVCRVKSSYPSLDTYL